MKKYLFKLFHTLIIITLSFQAQSSTRTIKFANIIIKQAFSYTTNYLFLGTKQHTFRNGDKQFSLQHQGLWKQGNFIRKTSGSPLVQVANRLVQATKSKASNEAIGLLDTLKGDLPSTKDAYEVVADSLDSTWHYINSYPSTTYFNLPLGIHKFQIKVANHDEIGTNKAAQLTITIRSPWYQTWWYCLIILGLLAFGVLRVYHLNKQIDSLKALVLPPVPVGASPQTNAKDKEVATTKFFLDNQEEVALLKQKLYEVVVEQELYKEENISLTTVAQDMQVTDKKLSEFLNRELHTSFYDYINRCKVNAFKERVKKGDAQHLKLIAIAYESGFHSKATFNRIFKRYTGYTPSQYRQMIEESSDL